jgi:arylamine N-acetyltransferase
MEFYRDGHLKHGYSVNPAPRHIQEFEQIIADSYRDDSTFMNALLLARFYPSRSRVLHNLTLIESQGSASNSQALSSRDELVLATHEYFGIPKKIIREVVAEIRYFGDAWH